MTKDRERVPRDTTSDGVFLDANHQPVADPYGNRAQRRLAARAKHLREKAAGKKLG